MAQFARPDSNVTQTAFTGGFAEIDEATASDADFAVSPDNTLAQLEVGLSDVTDPGVSTGHVVRVRLAKADTGVPPSTSGNAQTGTASLYQGTTLIAADVERTLGAWTTFAFTLSGAQADAITDYTDLRIRFDVPAGGGGPGGNRRGAAISWAELETPDAPEQHSGSFAESMGQAIALVGGPPREVAFDAVTEDIASTDPQAFTHTPVGTPRGVVVLISHSFSSDRVSGITYGGVALTRVQTNLDSSGEVGRSYVYFLGSGIPSGAQTVSVDKTQVQEMFVCVITLTADGDTEVVDSDGLSGDVANPAVTLQYGGREALSLGILWTGHDALASLALLSGMSAVHDHDFGSNVSTVDRQSTAGTSDFTIGYTATFEDTAFCAIAVAVAGGEQHSGSFALSHGHSTADAATKGGQAGTSVSHGHAVAALAALKAALGAVEVSHGQTVVSAAAKAAAGTMLSDHGQAATATASKSTSGEVVPISHGQTVGQDGQKAASGGVSVEHAHTAGDVGSKGASDTFTVNHGQTITIAAGTAFSAAHGQTVSVAGAKATQVVLTASQPHEVVTTGQRRAPGEFVVAHGHSAILAGRHAALDGFAVPHGASVTLAGLRDAAASFTVVLPVEVDLTGVAARSGSFTVAAGHTVSIEGGQIESHSGSFAEAADQLMTIVGRKGVGGSLAVNHGHSVTTLAQKAALTAWMVSHGHQADLAPSAGRRGGFALLHAALTEFDGSGPSALPAVIHASVAVRPGPVYAGAIRGGPRSTSTRRAGPRSTSTVRRQ